MTPCFFISAPFGNYVKPKGCISVTGTWTLHPRGNRLWSILKTLRYDRAMKGWRNKLGLPNPGLQIGLERTFPHEVLSIAEVDKGDFILMNDMIDVNQNIEINFSCPNLKKKLSWESARVFSQESHEREWCLAKLSPLTTPEELEFIIEGLKFTQLHFSNTLPTAKGGVSGPVLKNHTMELIELVRDKWGSSVEIVAGGGVADFGAVSDYLAKGADHVSIGSVCFNPFKLRKLLKSLEL